MQLAAPVAAEGDQHERRRGGAFPLGVFGGEPEQGLEEAVHERRVGLNGLLARGAAEVSGSEEIDVGREVLPEQLEPEPPPTVRSLRRRFPPVRARPAPRRGGADEKGPSTLAKR